MRIDREAAWRRIVDVLLELRPNDGLERDELDRDVRLGETLGFSSVDSIHLMITLEDKLGRPLGLEGLVLRDGAYVGDLSLGELHDHVAARLGAG